MNTTANRLKQLREKTGLNQSQLAKKIGISEQLISKYERGERNPKIENLEALANFFKVPVSYLRGEGAVNRLKELRQQAGLSLAEVGKGVGLATNTIYRYETGQREPKIETWQKLANYFGVSVPSLMGLNEENISRIYIFKGNNSGGYRFVVLANSAKEAWELIKDRIDMNRNTYGYDNEFVRDIRNYSISSIDLNDAAPQVIEDWRR